MPIFSKACGTLAAALTLAAPCAAQFAEFRIVERTGRSVITGPADAELNLVVQARAIGTNAAPAAIGAFGFTIRFIGEPESGGVLARSLISNPDHTYATGIALSNSVGRGGLASQYSYLASISPAFNGVINASSGTFTNGPDQEIGLVAGYCFAVTLLNTPGMDADADGNPDTWSGNGSGAHPPMGVLARIDPVPGTAYFGLNNSWVDLYRFRYTPTSMLPRALTVHLDTLGATVSTSLEFLSGVWGIPGTSNPLAFSQDLRIPLTDGSAGACCDGQTGACVMAAPTACGGVFLIATTCSPNSCPQPGRCCSLTGPCSVRVMTLCTGGWTAGRTCSPEACTALTACCLGSGACIVVPVSICTARPVGQSACTANSCELQGRCCESTGVCTLWPQHLCSGIWTVGVACNTSTCDVGACCSAEGMCASQVRGACTGVWSSTVCEPQPCPQPGRCCTLTGTCSVLLASQCAHIWAPDQSCSPNVCDQYGACCVGGVCSLRVRSECVSDAAAAFAGFKVACGTSDNPIGCCPANFNMVNGLEVQDIYDFLAAWFGHDSRADFDANGSFGISDIVLFISRWTAGCS